MCNLSQALASLVLGAMIEVADQPVVKAPDPDEARMLTLKTLRLPVEGCITGSFVKAYGVLQASNLLERVEQAYATQLPVGQKPEFHVMSQGAGRYYYVNKVGERCDIREVWRRTDTNTQFSCAFYVQGERAFGRFESLIIMKAAARPAMRPEMLAYEADIRVWPHGAVVRVFLRYMPGVERYFQNKTVEMRGIISGIFTRLAGSEAEAAGAERGKTNKVTRTPNSERRTPNAELRTLK